MQLPRVLLGLWTFARTYAVAAALLFVLGSAFVEVYTDGTGPVPQQPLDGLLIECDRVDLSWNKGTRKGEIRLQVSIDDPTFENLEMDRKSAGSFHTMTDLKPGHTYYWRLVQDDIPSPVAWFETSTHATKF